MSQIVNKKQFYILIILAIFLLFSSIGHFSLIISKPCSDHHSPNLISSQVNANLNYANTDLPTSKSTKSFIGKSVNHCATCSTIITNYIVNFDYPIHSEQYLLTKFIPEYKEFIPELKPPKFI
ncbi:hypothetical protein J3U18_03755 [Gilliamella sp. B3482]|uniref:hypothetical protein n=1 Tax=unclassified Gilliamella TaxID=2685620 RepID=UPI001C69D705|nr:MULTISPECIES: hypothetical protein [unclassified Gilliamella]MCX8580798.1 hypothetical protein [Gilliamella sp. B3482]MCX8660522.1 hypothetical protein [Gilliamella sp. B2772]QYN41526.1 hypothetical protein GYM76_01685 [Gilliamella sp. ESL0443]